MTQPMEATRPRIAIYGANDDLIQIDGDIVEEFSPIATEGGNLLAFSDGTVLRIEYTDDSIWRITPIRRGLAAVDITQNEEDDPDNYTDHATLTDVRIDWVVIGDDIAHNRATTRETFVPVGVTSTPVDPTREGPSAADPVEIMSPDAARRYAAHLERLRSGLEERGWLPTMAQRAVEGGWIDLALDIADTLKREKARVLQMVYQRGKILDLCAGVAKVVSPRPGTADAQTWWSLDPAAVREALTRPEMTAEEALELASRLVTYANEANGHTSEDSMRSTPLSRDDEALHALSWQGHRELDKNGAEWDASDRAMLALLDLARDADADSPWRAAMLALALNELDDEELEEALAEWREATAPTPVPATPTRGSSARPGEVWDTSVPPGGYVCATCGTPTESEPCPDHGQPAEADELPEPCQPIGCDNGYHLPGCPYAAIDAQGPDTDATRTPGEAVEHA